jgi:hypothetical protein
VENLLLSDQVAKIYSQRFSVLRWASLKEVAGGESPRDRLGSEIEFLLLGATKHSILSGMGLADQGEIEVHPSHLVAHPCLGRWKVDKGGSLSKTHHRWLRLTRDALGFLDVTSLLIAQQLLELLGEGPIVLSRNFPTAIF